MLVKQCGGPVKQWNMDGETVWWNSGTVLVEQWNSVGGTVEQRRCNSVGVTMRWNSVGGGAWKNNGTVWWYSGTLFIK